jgi:hypothetical protein
VQDRCGDPPFSEQALDSVRLAAPDRLERLDRDLATDLLVERRVDAGRASFSEKAAHGVALLEGRTDERIGGRGTLRHDVSSIAEWAGDAPPRRRDMLGLRRMVPDSSDARTELVASVDPSAPGLRVVATWEGGSTIVDLPLRGTLTVGRGAEADVRIDHTSVSRRHARLVLGDTITVEDLGS